MSQDDNKEKPGDISKTPHNDQFQSSPPAPRVHPALPSYEPIWSIGGAYIALSAHTRLQLPQSLLVGKKTTKRTDCMSSQYTPHPWSIMWSLRSKEIGRQYRADHQGLMIDRSRGIFPTPHRDYSEHSLSQKSWQVKHSNANITKRFQQPGQNSRRGNTLPGRYRRSPTKGPNPSWSPSKPPQISK